MNIEKTQDKQGVKLKIQVSRDEVNDILTQTAARISTQQPIDGFRPGKAPYNVIAKKYGEEYIIREALDDIVNITANKALAEHQIKVYGQPEFDIDSLNGPQWVVEYTAKIIPMPEITLGDWQSKKIKRQPILVSNEDLDKSLNELARMARTENPVERPAQSGDKVVVDFDGFLKDLPIKGGAGKDFAVEIGEKKMIPGFEENLIGHSKGDQFEFDIKFPDDYHAKDLAGQSAKFKVKVNQVVEQVLPELNDEFAKRMGMENLQKLKDVLQENLGREKLNREEEKLEIETVRLITQSSTISDLPEKIVEDTATDLKHEFEHDLAHQGLNMDVYLSTVKKTMDQYLAELKPKAVERVKAMLAMSAIAVEQKMTVSEKEIDEELQKLKVQSATDPHMMEHLQHPQYRNHLHRTLLNRKVIEFAKSKIVENPVK